MLDRALSIALYLLRSANWLGLVLSAGALCLSLRRVEWNSARAALAGLNVPLLGLTLATATATVLVKAARWRSLLIPDRVPLADLVFTLLVGQLVNSLLPARLGELARVYLLGERRGLGKARVLATILVEKSVDTAMLLGLLLSLLAVSGAPLPSWFRSSAAPLVAVALLLFVLVLLTTGDSDLLRRIFTPLPPSWRERLLGSMEGMRVLRQADRLGLALAWSVLVWALASSTNYALFRAFRLEQSLPLSAPVVVLVAIHLGAVFPSAPAQIGVFHYLCLLSLAPFGIEQSVALSYAVVLHLAVYLPIAVLGSLGLWREGWDLGRLHRLPSAGVGFPEDA